MPGRIDTDAGSIGYQHTDVESFYRQQYTVISELKRRFEQNGMGVAQELETLLLDDVQVNSPTTKVLMSEVNKLLQIYYTLPLTSDTAERTFSAMRRLKNYMRATMTQKMLNNIMIMHCHKDRVDALDLITVAKTFIDANDRRQKFVGSF